MSVRPIFRVVVCGAGVMGQDIAKLMARQNLPVVMRDTKPGQAEAACENIHAWIDKSVRIGKNTPAEAQKMKSLVSVASDWSDLQEEGQIVIEAIPEVLKEKQGFFAELEAKLPKDAILTSNTSALPITDIVAKVADKSRVGGMHFFNPPTKMQLVEVIPTAYTSADVTETIMAFVKDDLNHQNFPKHPIVVKDRTGFLVNPILGAWLRPVLEAVESEHISLETLDRIAREFGWPQGPFEIIDHIGIDTCLHVTKIMHGAYPERFPLSPLLAIMVKEGRLGKKSGAGFYAYDERHDSLDVFIKRHKDDFHREEPMESDHGKAEQTVFEKQMSCMVDEAARAAEERIASPADIDRACVYGIGAPHGGPLHWADKVGLHEVVTHLGRSCKLIREMKKKQERFFVAL